MAPKEFAVDFKEYLYMSAERRAAPYYFFVFLA